jgi:hypothetical protein
MNRHVVEQKFCYFLSKDSRGPHPSRLDIHLLNAWRKSTLESYNSAVKRIILFLRAKHRWSGLPLLPEDLWDFCLEVGHTMDDAETIGLAAKTLQRYLFGIKAWHVFHGKQYPHEATERVKMILRACARADTILPPQHLKKAIHI